MRGLDIGCETCISVNSRGMMAIQHQVSKDGVDGVRPSFVDFIMTCIEDDAEEEAPNDDSNESVARRDTRQGMRDVTNDASVEDASVGKGRVYEKHSRRTRQQQTSSSTVRDPDSDDDNNAEVSFEDNNETETRTNNAKAETNTRNSSAASRILGELELDKDMLSPKAGGATKRRMSALADIRRRRGKKQSVNKTDSEEESESEANSASNSGKKRRASGESESEQSSADENESTRHSRKQRNQDTPQDPASDSSESDNNDDDSDPDDALDVTAEIPQIFSKSSSMRTSRHGSRRSSGEGTSTLDTGDSEEEADAEPRMMYGDTKLEFTQDDYCSDDST
jgi:hypothetical protein